MNNNSTRDDNIKNHQQLNNSQEWDFIHLNLHTEYSLFNSLIKIPQLIEHCTKNNIPAIAITDHHNLCGAIKFYQATIKARIKPIVGCQFSMRNPKSNRGFAITLLAKNYNGYLQLMNLSSQAYTANKNNKVPYLEKTWLNHDTTSGLIALSGGQYSEIGEAILEDTEEKELDAITIFWCKLFRDRFYIELQRIGQTNEEKYIYHAVNLANRLAIPVVATNNVYFLQQNNFEAHEVRTCITSSRQVSDKTRPRNYLAQQFLCSQEHMQKLFADIPTSISNSKYIAQRCTLYLDFNTTHLPNYKTPDNSSAKEFLRFAAEKKLDKYLAKNPDLEIQSYQKRLTFELDVIIQMGFASYFLIVMEFIAWSKNNSIPVGPGRGSGAGSLVAYCLQITDIDPIKYDLLFERFLNPERISMPDFDIDFCINGREKVIEHVTELYGRDAVSQIITFNAMTAKAVVRDTARALGKPYALGDKLAKLIPFDLGITLSKAKAQETALVDFLAEDIEASEVMSMSEKLEGLIRNVGTHAGGVIIAPSQLVNFAPIYVDTNMENAVSQYDKKSLEEVGLVKFDFLGLRTLTIIDKAWETIYKRYPDKKFTAQNELPLDDAATFQMLQTGFTTGVFQLESSGMQNLIRQMKPDCFEDIAALVALFRPGPLQSGMVEDFNNRKNGKSEIQYLHPLLEDILKETYGVILYQEQVMKIPQVMCGYSLGQADVLRRAMGYKDANIMAQQKEQFCKGAVNNNIDMQLAEHIFDLIEKFAGYGFNKSHSVAYAKVSYDTAWLKTHYPAEFMAAILTQDAQNTDKLTILVAECKRMKLQILPPDINTSTLEFSVHDSGTIIYGLKAIKGVSQSDLELIICEREKSKFNSLLDFCQRAGVKCKKNTYLPLLHSGALDPLSTNRATIEQLWQQCLDISTKKQANQHAGINDLFANMIEDTLEPISDITDWHQRKKIQLEKQALGLYLTAHPTDIYQQELNLFNSTPINKLAITTKSIAGLIVSTKLINKNNKPIFICMLEDKHAKLRVTLFKEKFEQFKGVLKVGEFVIMTGKTRKDKFTDYFAFIPDQIHSIAESRMRHAQYLLLTLDKHIYSNDMIDGLANLIQEFSSRDGLPVKINYSNDDTKVLLSLDEKWSVNPLDNLLDQLDKQHNLLHEIVY